MKYVIVLGDGMAGEPLEELQQKTTLEAARTPRIIKVINGRMISLSFFKMLLLNVRISYSAMNSLKHQITYTMYVNIFQMAIFRK